jgi:hypothetical protein
MPAARSSASIRFAFAQAYSAPRTPRR